MMKKKIFTIVAALLCGMATHAETVKWVVKPEYQKIVRYSEDLFKCQDENGKWQLVELSGNSLGHLADSITDYDGGYALLLDREGAKYRIIGFVSEQPDHAFQEIGGKDRYYTARYSFFSGNRLAVADANGLEGYIDENGKLVISCQYGEARPYRYGYASVVNQKKRKDGRNDVNYIDLNGKTNGPVAFSSSLTYGTSFNEHGHSVVGNYQKFAIIDSEFKVVKSGIKRPAGSAIKAYDCSYCPNCSDNDNLCPIKNDIPAPDGGMEIMPKDGGFVYAKNGTPILPQVFDKAERFAGGYAIAAVGSTFGVLKIEEGEFVPHWPDMTSIRVYDGMKCKKLHFSIDEPQDLEDVVLSFNNNGKLEGQSTKNFDFKPQLRKGETKCKLSAEVKSNDGLLLWQGEKELDLVYVKVVASAPALTSAYADENDNQTVKTVITNNSSVSVKVKASLKLCDKSNSFNETLAPGKSKTLTVTVKVTEERNGRSEKANVAIEVDGGFSNTGNSSDVKLQLI